MASAENRSLPKPHYIVRRSRSGRFNFALITEAGRFTGYVTTSVESGSNDEMKRQAQDKIRALAESFAEATSLSFKAEDGAANETEAGEPASPFGAFAP
jgi:hypothetical protein